MSEMLRSARASDTESGDRGAIATPGVEVESVATLNVDASPGMVGIAGLAGPPPMPVGGGAAAPVKPAGTTGRPISGLSRLRRSAEVADRWGGQPVPAPIGQALQRRRGGGSALPSALAADYGGELGVDISAVRIHTDAEADRISRSMDAAAFTHGTDIYFSAGAYRPDTAAGQHTLAHELAHVAQPEPAAGGGVVVGRADDPAEAEADRVASRVVGALRRQASRPDPAQAPEHCASPLSALRRQAVRNPEKSAIRRRFALRVDDGTEPIESDHLNELLEHLRPVCEVPEGVAEALSEAAVADDVFELTDWLAEHCVRPRSADAALQQLVAQAMVEASLIRGLATLRALATGLAEAKGKPVIDVPGAPAVKLGAAWLSRAELRSKYPSYMPAFDDEIWATIPFGYEFGKDFDVMNWLSKEDRKRKDAREWAEQQERAKAKAALESTVEKVEPVPVPSEKPVVTTSLSNMIPSSEQYEQELGRAAYDSPISMNVAQELSERVLDFIARFKALTERDLLAEIGTANPGTAGAVGEKPDDVREALEKGTLHERLTHVLNFGQTLANLLVEGKSAAFAKQAATDAGFDAHHIDTLAKSVPNKAYNVLSNLKSEVMTRKSGSAPITNQRPADELGMTFSEREKALWGKDKHGAPIEDYPTDKHGKPVPSFEVGADNVDVTTEHEWVVSKNHQGFPVKSGPSTHTFELFEMTALLGLRGQLSLDEIMIAATGYLLPISAHSLIEIQHVAEQFGLAPVEGPELYGRLMVQLKKGIATTSDTRQALSKLLGAELTFGSSDDLVAAHHYLLSHGYSFVGFHGTKTAEAAKSIKTGGLDPKYDPRKEDDPWRGAYVAPDSSVAKGYLVTEGSQLLRIYAPTAVVMACIQARLPLSEGTRVEREISRRLESGSLVPQIGDYLILGRESAEDDSLESVLSWGAALQCVAIPSLHSKEKLSDAELGLPQQTANPRELTAEHQHSDGGLEKESYPTKGDPREWTPSHEPESFGKAGTDWDIDGYTAPFAKRLVTDRERELLAKLGFEIAPHTPWNEVAKLTLQKQANASTLADEFLPSLAKVPFDSPIWSDFVYRFKSAETISQVEPGLYLGGWLAASDSSWQKSHVGTVLNCCQYNFPPVSGVKQERVDVTGYPVGLFEWASNLIGKASKSGVLVHCLEGKNRSATLVAGYLMKAHRWDAKQAVREVTAARPWASPDLNDLFEWQQYLAHQGLVKAPEAAVSTKKSGKGLGGLGPSGLGSGSESWPGENQAMLQSIESAQRQESFAGVGSAVGLDRFLELHNSPGEANNCLIHSMNRGLRLSVSDERINEIGEQLRGRKDAVGVESNGFLNARAVPHLLSALQQPSDTADTTSKTPAPPLRNVRVVLIDTTGQVDSPETGGVATYAAEVINAAGTETVILVNAGNVHFGYASLIESTAMTPFGGSWVDGNQWVQFTKP